MSAYTSPRPSISRNLFLGGALALLGACGGGSGDAGAPPEMPPAKVSVATMTPREVSRWNEFSGRFVAVNSVDIRPRVAGYIQAIHFDDGALVAAGDLLLTIDDREYRAAVLSAQANVAAARTRLDLARTELARSEKLAAVRAASAEELEQRQGAVREADAAWKSVQAALTQVQLNLEFTEVRAPIAGRVSDARVRVGNLVGSGEPVLTTLVSIDPIDVAFDADESIYLAQRRRAQTDAAPVRVALAQDSGFPHLGELVFVDNALDPGTGTIRARARLANANGLFTPGLFARVQLQQGAPAPALLVTPQALLTDQDRRYVYVVGDGARAERRDVVLGAEVDGLRVVESGLAAGDQVVVNGVRHIFFPGQSLVAREVPMDQPNQPESTAAPVAAPAKPGAPLATPGAPPAGEG